jgi:MinD superfamily P-loop ATPase
MMRKWVNAWTRKSVDALMSECGRKTQAAGCRTQVTSCRRQDTGYRMQVTGCRSQDTSCKTQAANLKSQVAGEWVEAYMRNPVFVILADARIQKARLDSGSGPE